MKKEFFFVELTDTYGGEANYSWVSRFLVSAKSTRGAILKVNKKVGYTGRLKIDYSSGDLIRHNVIGACVCFFTTWVDAEEVDNLLAKYLRIEVL